MSGLIQQRSERWVVVVLVILALAPFLQSRSHDFVNYDDNLYVTENRTVQQGLTWAGVQYAFTTFEGGNWHPVAWLSHMIDCELFRLRDGSQWPGGHHLISIIIHAVNTILLLGLLRRMTGSFWRSALVAALFAVHPIHVESVAWVSERKDVLSTMFGLLALRSYWQYTQKGGWAPYLAMLGWYALSLLTKPMLVTLPFLMLVLDAWPLGRWPVLQAVGARPSRSTGPGLSALVKEKIPVLVLAIGFSATAIVSQKSAKALSTFEMVPLTNRLANAAVAYVEYLHNTFVPTNLAVFYPHPGTWPTTQVILSIVILLAITLMVVATRRAQPWLLVGWLWYLGLLVPVIGIVQVGLQSMADRYMYLPVVGVFIMIVFSIPSFAASGVRLALGGVAVAGAFGLAVMSAAQTAHWETSRTLFTQAMAATKNNFLAHQNLGNALERDGELDAALSQYQRAVDLRGQDPKARQNVANVLIQKGRLDEAIEQIKIAITIDPESYSAYNSLGVILLAKEQFAEAERAFARAVELDPANFEARGNHGVALLKTGRFAEAVNELTLVKSAFPQRYGVRSNLALALAGSGRRDQALAELQEILTAKPDFAPALAARRQIQEGGVAPSASQPGSLSR